MTMKFAAVTFDCDNALATAQFWAAALGHEIDPGGSERFASIGMGGTPSPGYMFQKVPENRTAKNRVHVDLLSTDRAADVARLVELGAKHLHDVDEHGFRWSVLQDPEGNEFCVAEK